jgi:DNA polymerase III delta prime subunit
MSKFHELFPDLQELFTEAIKKIDSFNNIKIKIIANDALKEITKVSKANDLTNYLTDEDVIIQVHEGIFEKLDEKQQAYVIDETLARIYVDLESGKIKMIQPEFTGFMEMKNQLTPLK